MKTLQTGTKVLIEAKNKREPRILKSVEVRNLRNEIWKPIPGFEDFYHVSNMGRVKSLHKIARGKGHSIKAINYNNKGYAMVALCDAKSRKVFLTHRLVMYAFVGVKENMLVDHINHNPKDNRLSNLRYCERIENNGIYRRQRRTRSGFKNIYLSKRGVYTFSINYNKMVIAMWKNNLEGLIEKIREYYNNCDDNIKHVLNKNLDSKLLKRIAA